MNRWFKYIIVSTIMALSIFFLIYYQKGEYNYVVFMTVFFFIANIFFDIKFHKLQLIKI